jgi:dolichyl-phosphate-mannose-protein mannosyltransferase
METPDPPARVRVAPPSRRATAIGVAVALVVHLAAALLLDVRANVHVDESYTLQTTANGPGAAYHEALRFELQPPLYFVAVAAARAILPEGLLGVRLFSTLCTVVFLAVAAATARELLGRRAAPWSVAALALHPFLLYAATQARCYGLVLLLLSLFLRLLLRLHLRPGLRPGSRGVAPRAALVLLAAAALYTHVYSGFVLAAGAVAILVAGRRRSLAAYLVEMAVVALLFVPGFLWLPGLVEAHTAAYFTDRFVHPLKEVAADVAREVLGFFLARGGAARIAMVAAMSLAALVAVVRRGRGPIVRRQVLPLAALVVTGALAFFLVGWRIDTMVAQPRHLAGLLLPVALLAFAVARAAGGARGVTLLGVVMTAWSVWGSVEEHGALAKPGDWNRVAAWIADHEQDGEPIVVVPAEVHGVFTAAYHGRNVCRGFPGPEKPTIWNPRQYDLKSGAELAGFVRGFVGAGRRFWLVEYSPGLAAVAEFVAQCRVSDDHEFLENRVRRLELTR